MRRRARAAARQPALELHALRGGHRRGAGQDVGHQVTERDALELQAERAGLGPAQLEQVVDERGEVIDLLAESAEVTVDGRGIFDDAVLERLDDRAHAGEWGAQVV